jgi:hypothetical protein
VAADVTVRAVGNGTLVNYAVCALDSGTAVTLERVTALAENASTGNYGLYNFDGSSATLRGGSYTGRGGSLAYGIYNGLAGATLHAESVEALGENGSNGSYGLVNYLAAATLRGGSFTARGDAEVRGLSSSGVGSSLDAEGCTALGDSGGTADYTYGLYLYQGAATLRGGSFTGRGGQYARGVNCDQPGATLQAESITALAEEATSTNHGLHSEGGAEVVLRGGSFTGRDGSYPRGIYNWGSTLEADGVAALGENGSSYGYGLYNYDGATATLRGGSFIGRGGTQGRGVMNYSSTTSLDAERISAMGVDGSSANYGLYNGSSAVADITQSVLSGSSNSIYRPPGGGDIHVSNTRLIGAVSAEVTCVAVSRLSNFYENSCP